jgi:CubicO group peptidase (beta-lactamase class C family)
MLGGDRGSTLQRLSSGGVDRLLLRRFVGQLPSGGNIPAEAYGPFDRVGGGPDVGPLPHAQVVTPALQVAFGEVVAGLAPNRTQAVLLAVGGELVGEWFAPDRGPESLFQSQSMHKTVQAMLVGAAIADGHLDGADDPVGRYLPEWKDDLRGAITVGQLMAMRSGLALIKAPAPRFWRMLFAADSRPVVLSAELVARPGAAFQYNDVNAALLGLVLEGATGRPYSAYLHEKLAAPLGFSEARVWLSDEAHRRPHTECCLLARAQEWVRIGMLLRDRGRFGGTQVLPAAWVDRMLTPAHEDTPFYGYLSWIDTPGATGPPWEKGVRAHHAVPGGDLVYLAGYGGQRTWISRSLDAVMVRFGPYAGRQPIKRPDAWDNAGPMHVVEQALNRS